MRASLRDSDGVNMAGEPSDRVILDQASLTGLPRVAYLSARFRPALLWSAALAVQTVSTVPPSLARDTGTPGHGSR
jgi:hypothetical protein